MRKGKSEGQSLTIQYKLKLDFIQELKLNTMSNEHRILYNYLLNFARTSWFSGKGADFKGINQEYKNFRINNNLTISSKSAQNTSNSLIESILAFYKLRKDPNNKAKFPKNFKSHKFFCSFKIDSNCGHGGFTLENEILKLSIKGYKNFLELHLNNCQLTTKEVKNLTFLKKKSSYYVYITYNIKPKLLEDNGNYLSIDPGVKDIVTCYSNKVHNFSIENTKFKKLEKQKRILQSIKDKKKKKSKKWKKINKKFKQVSTKISNKNKDFQHKVAKNIVDICKENNINTIVFGDSKNKKMVKKGKKNLETGKNYKTKQEKGLNTSTQGRGTLSRFKKFLEYKSTISKLNFIKVNEAYTSQENCLTGIRELSSDLDNREVQIAPNLIIDRDLNSAINILKRHKANWSGQFQDFNLDKIYMDLNSNLFEIKNSNPYMIKTYNFV